MYKLIIVFLLIGSSLTGFIALSLNSYDIEEVIICSTNNESHFISSKLCSYYLFNYRGNKNDIYQLSQTSNLNFLVSIQDKKQRKSLFDFFIKNGSDINGISHIDGLTPLHSAILINDAELVKYLLSMHADPTIIDKNNHLTAIQFLNLLTSRNPEVDREKIRLLFQYK